MTARPEDVGLATLPSHDDTAEAAVLGAILVSPACLDLVAAILPEPEAIYSPARREVYRAALALRAARRPVEVLALRGQLAADGRLEKAGGVGALAELAGAAPPGVVLRPSEIEPYARDVAKLAGLRAAQRGALRAVSAASEGASSDRAVEVVRGLLEEGLEGLVPADAWPELEPLTPAPPPPFPLEALPDWFAAWVEATAERLQVPPDWPALFGLAGFAMAAQGSTEVEIVPGWAEPVGIYLAVGGEVAGGKTPAMEAALAPIREWEAELVAAARPFVARARTRAEAAEAERRTAISRAGRATEDGERASAENDACRAAERVAEIVVPSTPLLASTNATPEGLVRQLDEAGGVAAVLSDEGGAFFGVTTGRRYNAGGEATLDEILKAYSGSPIAVKRKVGDPLVVPRPRLTIALGLQPELVEAVAADKDLASRGVLARFFWSVARDRVGSRLPLSQRRPVDPALPAAYRNRIRGLLGDPEEAAARLGQPRRVRFLRLSAGARAELDRLFVELEPRLGPEGDLSGPVRAWVAKQGQGPVARLAALLHLAEDRDLGPEIHASTLARAVALFRYGAEHAAVALGGGDRRGSPVAKAAERALAWLRRRPEADRARVTRRSLGRHGARLGEDEIAPAVALLVARGYLQADPEARGRDGRRARADSATWRVNPAVYAPGGAP